MDTYPKNTDITNIIDTPLVLDGATGTNLYIGGLPRGACVEQWILDNPQVIQSIQSGFYRAGSDICYAPTFSANREKLTHFGLQDKVEQLNQSLVALTRDVALSAEKEQSQISGTPVKPKLVAGNMSPTGLFIEPFGETSMVELISIYKEQAKALYLAGVDLFVIETMMSLSEARAAVLACRDYKKPIFVTITVNERGKTLSGTTPLNCLITLQELGIFAFGLNCSYGPDKMLPILEEIIPFAKIPVIAKPNAGQPNILNPNQYDLSPKMMAKCMKDLLNIGVRIVGGCCGSTAEHVAAIREVVDNHEFTPIQTVYDNPDNEQMCYLSDETHFFMLDSLRLEVSNTLTCEVDMADLFLDIEDDSIDMIKVHISSPDDAKMFALNAHFCSLPVCFYSEDEVSLKTALLLYNARAMIDTDTTIPRATLEEIATKYGAILY